MDYVVLENLLSNYVNLKCSGNYDLISTLKVLKQGYNVASRNGLNGIFLDVTNVKAFTDIGKVKSWLK